MNPVIVGQGYKHTFTQMAPNRFEVVEETVIEYILVMETNGDFIKYRFGSHLGNLTQEAQMTNYNFHRAIDKGNMVLVKDIFLPVHFPNSRLMEIE